MNDQLKIEGVNKDGFGIIPKLVMQDRELHINSKAIYAYFCSYAGTGSACFPTRKKICYDMSISNDTLSKYLNELIKRGYISCQQAKEKGKFSHNVYTLNSTILPCPKVTDTETPEYEKLDTKNNSTKNNSINKNNNTNIPSTSIEDIPFSSNQITVETDYNADNNIKDKDFYEKVKKGKQVLMNGMDIAYAFDMLYKQYPKRVAKKEAAFAFIQCVRENTREKVIELAINIDTYRKYTGDNGTEQKYIKNMQGFINDTQYNEYPKFNCDVLINDKYYETKEDYMDAVKSGEVKLYCLPQSCIMF